MSVIVVVKHGVMQASSSINNRHRYSNIGKKHASKVKSGSFDGTLYTEHSGTTFVAIFENISNKVIFCVHHMNIWQTVLKYVLTNLGWVIKNNVINIYSVIYYGEAWTSRRKNNI